MAVPMGQTQKSPTKIRLSHSNQIADTEQQAEAILFGKGYEVTVVLRSFTFRAALPVRFLR